MQNTITAGNYTIKAAKKHRPFGNSFTVLNAAVVQYEGQDEIAAHVLCTNSSKEPGRKYFVQYNTAGELMECNTTN